MRRDAVDDCIAVLGHFGIDPGSGEAIDVGGTQLVYLDSHFAPNPLRELSPGLVLLDRGFNAATIGTKADFEVDFLDRAVIAELVGRFRLVYCFDTLEHVQDPFRFCEHLLEITAPGGHVYVATVFEWPYHPSPDDYFRFSPAGLLELFTGPRNRLRHEAGVVWCGWGRDPRGVVLLAQRVVGCGREGREHPTFGSSVPALLGEEVRTRSAAGPPGVRPHALGVLRAKLRSAPRATIANLCRRGLGAMASRFVYPVRLDDGTWMLTWPDVMGHAVRAGTFEVEERAFITSFLKPGQVVLDVGAHNGLYTLLASVRVGPGGRVISFEPSPRERRRLRFNLWLNRLSNVIVESSAVSDKPGSLEFHMVVGRETGFSGLRRPAAENPVRQLRVSGTTVDRYCAENRFMRLDFMKLDVEGGEYAALVGSERALAEYRPVIMCELADVRCAMWGYEASRIYDHLRDRDYVWFSFTHGGSLSLARRVERYHGNLLAVPRERLKDVTSYVT